MTTKKFYLILILIQLLNFSKAFPFGLGDRQSFYLFETDTLGSLNLFDFGGNPAWLKKARVNEYLQFGSYSENSWGNYRRRFDPEGKHINHLGFSGVTRLDNKSTFYGESSYIFDLRSNQNRSLKYDTYSGEAFFMTDTVKGNFLYHGPQIGLIYNIEILPKLLTGIKLNYKLLDGLKSNYSQAQSAIRDIYSRIGAVYSFSRNFSLGTTFDFFDVKESIDTKGNELYMVDIYNFRGDTYSVKSSGSNIVQKVLKKGTAFGTQILYTPDENWVLGLSGGYSKYSIRNLLTRVEKEDGHANFEKYNLEVAAKYDYSTNIKFRSNIGYNKSESWSRHSKLNLLIWKWDYNDFVYSAGLSYNWNKTLQLSVDYIADAVKIDSSKFIDRKFNSLRTLNHYGLFGIKSILSNSLQIHSSINLGKVKNDPIIGEKNFYLSTFNIGSDYFLTKVIRLLIDFNYSIYNKADDSLTGRKFNVYFTVHILK